MLLSSLPGSLVLADIGSPTTAGSAAYTASSNQLSITSSGTGFSLTSDQYTQVAENFTGSGAIVAEVAAVPVTAPAAEAGVVLRDSSSASAAYAAVVVNAAGQVSLDYRAADGGSEAIVTGGSVTAGSPVWLSLSESNSNGSLSVSGSYSTDGVTYTAIGSGPVAVSFSSSTNLAGFEDASGNAAQAVTGSFNGFSITQSGYGDQDIGSPAVAGNALYDPTSGTWTVTGGGADIWGTSDQFNFASTALAGGGQIVARVTSQSDPNSSAKVGVMVRDGMAANAAYADVLTTPGNLVLFEWRASDGAQCSYTAASGITAPEYVKLVLTGDNAGGFYSADGTHWTQLGAWQTLGLTTTPLAGLAATGHDNSTSSTATFTNVAVTPAALPAGYSDADIGSPAVLGGAQYDASSGTWTITGGGSDIWGTSDQFNFASTAIGESGQITARETSQSNANAAAKSGVMIRNGTAANAAYADVLNTPNGALYFQWRSSDGANCAYAAGPVIAAPVYIRLVRTGDNVGGFYSTDSSTWQQIGTWQTIAFNTTAVAGLAVTNHDNSGACTATFDHVAVEPANLPTGFSDQDIGSPGLPGGALYHANTSTLVVSGGGLDIWNSSDQFNFASTSWSGDGQVVAQVTSQENTSAWAKAGVMMRASSAANSPFVDVVVTPANGVVMQWRDDAGQDHSAGVTGPPPAEAPLYLMLQRQGGTFTGYYSVDGTHWTAIDSVNITMGNAVLTGLAVTAQDNNTTGAAVFSDVSVGALQAVANTPPVPAIWYANPLSGDAVELAWQGGSTPMTSVDHYSVNVSSDGGKTWQQATANANSSDTFLVTGLSPSTAYQFQVMADSSSNMASAPAQTAATTQAAAPQEQYKVTLGDSYTNPIKGDAGGSITDNLSLHRDGTVSASSPEMAILAAVTGSIDGDGGTLSFPMATVYKIGTPKDFGNPSGTGDFNYLIGIEDIPGLSGQDGEDSHQADNDYNDFYIGVTVTGGQIGCGCGDQRSTTASGADGGAGDNGSTGTGTSAETGSVSNGTQSAGNSGFGVSENSDASWTNDPSVLAANSSGNTAGNGVVSSQRPTLTLNSDGSVAVTMSAGHQLFFYPANGGGFTGGFYQQQTLALNAQTGNYVLTGSDGVQISFYGYSSSLPVAQRGQYMGYTDAAGNNETTQYNSAGQLLQTQRSDAAGNVQTYAYTYNTTGQISVETLTVQSAGQQTAQIARQTYYSYYGGTYTAFTTGQPVTSTPNDSAYGNTGDLRTVTTVNVSNGLYSVVNQTYDRYYTAANSISGSQTIGYTGALRFSFDANAFARLQQATGGGENFLTATDQQIAPYANSYYQYNSAHRALLVGMAGSGGATSTETIDATSVATPGIGTYLYNYDFSGATPGYNQWDTKTTETLPDGNQNITYSNFAGEPVLKLTIDNSDPADPALQGSVWATGYQYDSQGRLTETINPSAFVAGYYNLGNVGTYEAYADLGFSEGAISATGGLIDTTTYYATTTATTTAPGGVAGYTYQDFVQQGSGGTPILQDSTDYIAHTSAAANGGATIYPVADTTRYQSSQNGGSVPETTSQAYTWQSNANGATNQQASDTTTLPIVPTTENGSGVANSSTDVFDLFGRVVWSKDAAGYITYTAYDNATGAVIQSVQDVNTSNLSDLANDGAFTGTGFNTYGVPALPAGWTTPSGGGLNLITTDYVDSLGRTIEESSPSANPASPATTGDITLTVYDDANHATYTLPGVVVNTQNGTLTTTGPITVSRTRIPYTYSVNGVTYAGTYDETLTMSANGPIAYTTAANGAVVPTMPGFTGSLVALGTAYTIQTLSRDLYNNAGQMVESDQYAIITNAIYNATAANSPYSGSAITNGLTPGAAPNGNYYASFMGYDREGRQYQSVDANGTITDTVYDGMDRAIGTWVGTNDATSNGLPFNGTHPGAGNNMVQTDATVYDNNAVGDGNATETVQFPSGSAAGTQRVTLNDYDFRDRFISTESGLTLGNGANIYAGATQSASVPYPQITVTLLDNVGDAFNTYMLDGNAVSMASTSGSGVPDSLASELGGPGGTSASNLRGFSATGFDTQNRSYIDQTYPVDPVTGAIGVTALTSYTFYGLRGNTVETISPGGQVTKDVFDGADRQTFEYITDGGAVNNSGAINMSYASAGSVANDVVLTQTQNIYNPDSNLIETITSDRFNTDATTATGALGTPTTGVEARVSYTGSYYDPADRDIADVNAGTNGGTAWSMPTTAPTGVNDPNFSSDLVNLTSYNLAGWVDTTTDPRGVVAKNFYDTLGRTTETIAAYDPTVNNGLPTTSQNQTTDYTFDGNGDQTSMTAVEPTGTPNETTDYLYGVSPGTGSLITSNDILYQTQYPLTQVNGVNVNNIVSVKVNALGEVTQMTDRNGTVHEYTHDTLGRQISDTITTLGTGVDGSVLRIDTAYNDAGLPYLYTSYADTAGTQVVNQVEDVYNGLGQLTQEFQAVNGAVDTSSTPYVGYGYSDPSLGSRLTSMAYPNGRTIDYNYTGNNANSALDSAISRLDSISDGANTPDAGTVLEQYSYLGLSTIVQAAHPQTNIDLSYILQPGQVNTINDGGDQYVGLDRFGRVIDQNWWNTATQSSTDRFQYGYDRSSNVLFKNNLVNPNQSELYHANSTTSGDNNTAYDPLSRETAFARGVLSASSNNSGMLDTISSPSQSQTWNLDALGNWSSFTDNGTNQSRNFNQQNQITSITGTTTTPAYDANGNMTTDQNGNTLVYDSWNRLVTVKNASGQIIASYTYDALGRRISETYPQGGNGIPAGTTKYLYYSNNWQVIETRWNGTAASNVQHQYVWSQMYIDAMVLRDTYSGGTLQANARIYTQFDANFNVTALVGYNSSTQSWGVLQRFTYTPYGVATVLDANWTPTTDQFAWQYMHQGGRLDPVTGLYLFRHRDYSPTLGNWIEQDPAGYVDGANRYAALGEDPAGFADPTGLRKPDTKQIDKIADDAGLNRAGRRELHDSKERGECDGTYESLMRKARQIANEHEKFKKGYTGKGGLHPLVRPVEIGAGAVAGGTMVGEAASAVATFVATNWEWLVLVPVGA